MTPPRPLGLVPRKRPFQPEIGIHISMRISEDAEGFKIAATRQKAGSALKGGIPRPPLYPRPKPAVLPVTLPGTSGTGPIVPASADEPPPPRPAGFGGTMKPPAFTTCASVIDVFGNASDASFSHDAGSSGVFCATAAPGSRTNVRNSA